MKELPFFWKIVDIADLAPTILAVYGVSELIRRGIRKFHRLGEVRSRLDELFGDAGNFQGFSGRDHMLFPEGQVHPDINDAAKAWVSVFSNERLHFFSPQDSQKLDESGNIIALGTPGSNRVSRQAFKFDGRVDELLPLKGFHRPRFDYIHAKSEVENLGLGIIRRYGNRRLLTTPNWIIIDTRTGREYQAQKDADDFITSDYLLLSRLPNTLNPKAIERGSEIIVFGGAHGVGLKGLKNLIFDENLLEELLSDIRGCRYFQAIFAIHGIQHLHSKRRTIPGYQFSLIDYVGYSRNPINEKPQ